MPKHQNHEEEDDYEAVSSHTDTTVPAKRRLMCPEHEEAVLSWFHDRYEQDNRIMTMTYREIKDKARDIAEEISARPSKHETKVPKVDEGWSQRFVKRNDLPQPLTLAEMKAQQMASLDEHSHGQGGHVHKTTQQDAGVGQGQRSSLAVQSKNHKKGGKSSKSS